MKIIYLLSFLLLTCFYSYAQTTLVGRWYSADSSRIYKIYVKEKGYEAILEESKRKNDKVGELVLENLVYNKNKKRYKGFIRAVNDGMTVQVKIWVVDDGKSLKLKIKRMMIFPVHLRWRKEGQLIIL